MLGGVLRLKVRMKIVESSAGVGPAEWERGGGLIDNVTLFDRQELFC